MTLISANRVREACSGSGLLNLTLLGAISGCARFTDKVQAGSLVPYILLDGNGVDYEIGFATLVSATELARTTVLDSSQTADRVNTDEPGTPVKITLSTNTHEVFIAPHHATIFTVDENGSVQNPGPLRAAIFVETFAAMTALPAIEDNETVLVKAGASAGDGKGGLFYFDDDDNATPADGYNYFAHDTQSGRFKRVFIDTQSLVASGDLQIDAAVADTTGGSITAFFRRKATLATAWARWHAAYAASSAAFKLGIRHLQASVEKFFISAVSTGDNLDRVELLEPVTLPTRTNANGLRVRGLTWLSGVSRLAMAQADAANSATAATQWEIPLTKGGFFAAVVGTITELKAIDAAALIVNGDRALVLGRSAVGDIPNPFVVQWNSSSSGTADDWSIFRPTVGAASSGNGRWLRVNVDPSTAFANSDATPSIANGFYFTGPATPPASITDFDDAFEGQVFIVARGSADLVITHNASLIDCAGYDLTLTSTRPRAMFAHINGVHRLISDFASLNPNNNLSDLISMATSRRNLKLRDDLRGATVIAETRFPSTSVPTGWANSGWTFSDKAISPAAASWSTVVKHDVFSSANRRGVYARAKLVSTQALFGISISGEVSTPWIGCYAEFDAPNATIRLSNFEEGSSQVQKTSAALGFALVANRIYDLDLNIDGNIVTFTIRDTVTGSEKTIQVTAGLPAHGKPGMLYRGGSGGAGDVEVLRFRSVTYVDSSPYIVIYGDSNTTTLNLGSLGAAWPDYLDTQRNRGDLACFARGLDTAALCAARVAADVTPFSPAYALICLGTNEIGAGTSQATWRTNMATLIAAVVARGAEPILCTVPPRTGSAVAVGNFNTDIRTNYFGNYRYIDFASALSASNDGVTWNPAYDNGDGIHANALGQAAMYEQVKRDCPFLLVDGGRGPLITRNANEFTGPQTFPAGGVRLRDNDASHVLALVVGSNLTADRTFTLTAGDANRSLTLNADVTITSTAAGLLDDANQAAMQTTLGLGTTDSPTFAGLTADKNQTSVTEIFVQNLNAGASAGARVSVTSDAGAGQFTQLTNANAFFPGGTFFAAPVSMHFSTPGNTVWYRSGTTLLTIGANALVSAMPVRLPVYTVGTLPAAATAAKGAKAYVSDSNTTTFNATVAGGGANNISVTSDGTNWKVG